MNIVKSHEWEILSDIIKKEDSELINYIFDFLTEETAKYEVGEAVYPGIEFAIAVAFDRKNEERKNKEFLAMPPQVPTLKIKIPPLSEQVVDEPILSPNSRREMVRNSWIQKFEKEKTEKEETKELNSEDEMPKPKPVSKPVSKPRIIKKRVIKKSEPEMSAKKPITKS